MKDLEISTCKLSFLLFLFVFFFALPYLLYFTIDFYTCLCYPQQAPVGVAPAPTTFVMVQQPITSQSVVEGGATGFPPRAYYSTSGEVGTPRYYAHPGPAGVGGGAVAGD